MRVVIVSICLAAAAAGCSSDPEVVCDGVQPICDFPSYVAICGEQPGTNEAIDEIGGLYCANRDNCTPSQGDLCLDYIGPAVELAPDCSGGQPAACPDGSQPICGFFPGCRLEELQQ